VANEAIDSLYKYCTAERGLQILRSGSLAWSAPHLFSDPFELNQYSSLEFGQEHLSEALVKAVVAMVFAKNGPTAPYNTITTAICRWRNEERFDSQEEAEDTLRDLLAQVSIQHMDKVEGLFQQWQEYVVTTRIARFSGSNTILPNWRNLADCHRGLALRFHTDKNPVFCNPVAVSYSNQRSHVTSLKEQLDVVLGARGIEVNDEDFKAKLTRKSKEFSYEEEWRCFYHHKSAEEINAANNTEDNAEKDGEAAEPVNTPSNDQLPEIFEQAFEERDLSAVYLGLNSSSEDQRAVSELLDENYPLTRLYKASRSRSHYELEYEPV